MWYRLLLLMLFCLATHRNPHTSTPSMSQTRTPSQTRTSSPCCNPHLQYDIPLHLASAAHLHYSSEHLYVSAVSLHPCTTPLPTDLPYPSLRIHVLYLSLSFYCTSYLHISPTTTTPSVSHPSTSSPYRSHDGGDFRPKAHSRALTKASWAPASSIWETPPSRDVRTSASGSGMRMTTAFAAAVMT